MQQFFWLFKMAWRDSRRNRSRLLLFMSSIVLGIAALVAINSFGENLTNEINNEARNLLGADVEIESRSPISDTLKQFLEKKGLELSEEKSFASMVFFPKNDGTRLINVRAVEEGYPFYGEIETTPIDAAKTFVRNTEAVVDKSLMLQFDAQAGDSVRLGTSTFKIAAEVTKTPGQSAISTTVAPPVFIPLNELEKTGLMKTGSRINYKLYGKFPEGVDNKKFFDEELKPTLEKYEVRFDDVEERKQELGDAYSDLTGFLNLTAFIALLLGCLGVASSVQVYIKSKVQTVAILRCMGASSYQTIWIYLIQIVFMGLVGSVLGVALGVSLQYLLPQVFADFLPFQLEMSISFISIIEGLALGLITALLFALIPLLSIRMVSPLKVLRSSYETDRPDRWRYLVYLLILLFIGTFTYLQLEDLQDAVIFTLGIFVSLGILAAIGKLIIWAVKRFFPSNSAFTVRQGLSNLYRPNNQTLLLVITIGLGTALITTLLLTQDLLLNKVKLSSSENQPNMVLFDIQSDQVDELIDITKKDSLPVIQEVPIVTMRLASIKGVNTNTLKEDTSYHVRDWVVNREYRVTYRAELIDSEELLKGEFTGKTTNQDSIFISLDDGLAEDMNVELGDKITWNVQGAMIPTYVSSLRKIDWQRVQTNFLVVFPTGVLEEAPKFHVLLTKYDDVEQSVAYQQKVVKNYPNISIIDLDLILKTLDEVLSKISFVIQFMAFFSIITGIIVLISSVNISKYQRMKEAVLLRTIGASKKQIFRISLMEYFFLGSISTLTGIFISIAAAWLLAYFSFETVFAPNFWSIIPIYLFITALTVVIGLLNSRSVVGKPPMVILRQEV
ncbi:ABC transporter permease [Marivirga atlantica]|jgi:putative ABC transport system permease protein|uniref:FtsX-like permease family protein n=1 Tax=Marivirga atlantica TaxID=1548457 RepID=A0A937DFN2_9BACT|nr:FtsX-like permease family protein [Marivirga atlantica]MBL0763863.1 FtsX-like permease family protein [Marivirga atlantica]